MAGRKILFCTFGSLGDLHPILAVAGGMKRRGHLPLIATSPCYRQLVQSHDLAFHPVRPDIDVNDPAALRLAMDRRTGMRYILTQMLLPGLRDAYQDTVEAARETDLIVTHPVTLAAFLVARKQHLPWATVALAPASLYSAYDPPVLSGLPFAEQIVNLRPSIQRQIKKIVTFLFELDWKPYRQFERELGLEPTPNPMLWIPQADLILALFSSLLGSAQSDWPSMTQLTGFPFLPAQHQLPAELKSFLNSGPPPIVFTLGSAAVGAAGDFFSQSADAAHRLGQRSVLLVGRDPRNEPVGALPPGTIAIPYAAHSALFPRASVVVHQGGIGTTAEALRAGKPMLVVPYSHDQPDHAVRLERLGVARSIPRERYNASRAEREIAALLQQKHYEVRAAEVGAKIGSEDGIAIACDLLCALLHRGSTAGAVSRSEAAFAG